MPNISSMEKILRLHWHKHKPSIDYNKICIVIKIAQNKINKSKYNIEGKPEHDGRREMHQHTDSSYHGMLLSIKQRCYGDHTFSDPSQHNVELHIFCLVCWSFRQLPHFCLGHQDFQKMSKEKGWMFWMFIL